MSTTVASSASVPYSVEVVPADQGWILETIANAITSAAEQSRAQFDVSVVKEPSGEADLVLFLPESAFRPVSRSVVVTYLAHKEDHPGAAKLFEDVAKASDVCITSSRRYKEVLERDGAKRVFVIPLGVDIRTFVPRLTIGVVGRTYETGRKGEHLLGPAMSLPYVKFVFTGAGWPYPSRYFDNAQLASLYPDLDYLLVPSLIEGGPVPLLEALACGCPVIAPSDVGFVEDFPHIPFIRGDRDDLRGVIEALLQQKLKLRDCVLSRDWEIFGRRHLELFAKLIEEARASGRLDSQQREFMHGAVLRSAKPFSVALVTHGAEATTLGGPTIRVRALAEHLAQHGLHVTVMHGLPEEQPAQPFDVVHVFNCWPLDSALETLLRARAAAKRTIFSPIALDLSYLPVYRELIRNALHDHGPEALEGWLKAVVAATPAREYEADVATPLEGVPGHFGALQRCASLADALIFLSEHERRFLDALGVSTASGTLIPNATEDSALDAPDIDSFRHRFALGRYVLCVGRLEYRKNQALLALAMREIDTTLVLIGADGDADYRRWIQSCGGRNVRFLDRIEDRRLLASAYAGADAFVFPSWVEGAPLVAIEAGLVGTPLILSSMSSEREYFGEFAHYVHPADIGGIADAVRACILNPESDELRSRRALFCRERYAFDRHARATLDAYRATLSGRRRGVDAVKSQPLMMDVSALVHFLMVEKPFTGVPTVEFNVLRALAKRDRGLKTVSFFGTERGFREIAVEDLLGFDKFRFIARYYSNLSDRTRRIARLEVSWPSSAGRSIVELAPLSEQLSFRKRAAVVLKYFVRHMPRPLGNGAVAVIRQVRPEFDPNVVEPAHNFLPHWKARIRKRVHALASSARADRRVPPPVSSVLHLSERLEPENEVIPMGARLLTLGQGWLSNGALLEELVRVVQRRHVALEPYVYDLSYHTGAHFSGWNDNDRRFARLLTLLSHSSRVYTECRQVEEELQKLRSARRLRFSTVRTGLSIREMPKAERDGVDWLRPRSFILYVSSFTRRKNHDFLVSVWRELHETVIVPEARDVLLLLVGEIHDEHHYGDPAFILQLEKMGIRILNEVSDPALTWLYENCLFTVYPSLMEGWGIPVQESLAKGKVCLVSTEVPVSQEVQNGALIKLEPHDFYGWFDALKTWLTNERLRLAFEEEACRYRAPSWDEISRAFLQGEPGTDLFRRSGKGMFHEGKPTDTTPTLRTS